MYECHCIKHNPMSRFGDFWWMMYEVSSPQVHTGVL